MFADPLVWDRVARSESVDLVFPDAKERGDLRRGHDLAEVVLGQHPMTHARGWYPSLVRSLVAVPITTKPLPRIPCSQG